MEPWINNLTIVTNNSKTCIDIFIKNIDINKVISYILRCDITNYCATTLILSDLLI